MKKLINDPNAVVAESLRGFAAAHADQVRVDHEHRVVYRAGETGNPSTDSVSGKVGIISGGGSGHEPLHAGYVGTGMLDAACAGEVFTSPVPDQMLAATRGVNRGAGVLYLVKNYTGDVMNFDMAAELAAMEDIAVEQVVIDDDVAVQDSTYTAGRRGVGGTVLIEKIVGAAAEQGRDLAALAQLARHVNAEVRSMGVALTPCTVPAAGKPNFELADNQLEMGVGIHGEPGRSTQPMASAAEIAKLLVEPVLADLPFSSGDRVIALVNGMGATPLIELYLMYAEIADLLTAAGITLERRLVGNYITSLEMAGCSLTLLRADDELVDLWDAPVDTVALRWGA